ncbi:hypothetical protein NLJ89_g6630 [Agrocybe chaxingu]|uniref:DUF6533 domain-containing protein n=1 Tax=Agrocybe chaxingu TaxID=84603 RepID=A0A9W8JW40_9AGAR|nr:hypothetical protein NLJ89_g6630 [Agrocybe chaxingu]
MSFQQVDADGLARAAHHLLAAKYFQIASFVMLVYDHAKQEFRSSNLWGRGSAVSNTSMCVIMLATKVERIWEQPFTGASLLFYLNRYGNLLEFIVIIDAFFDPNWPKDVCRRFVKFEGAGTIILVAICQLVMILRVYAIYERAIWILAFLLTLLAAQISISAVGINLGFPVPLPAPLAGSTSVFPALIITVLIRDGVMYFFVIFLTNLMNTVIYFQVEEDLKAIGASFLQLITSVMISRLILNLKGVPIHSLPDQNPHATRTLVHYRSGGRIANFRDDKAFFVLGNLGGNLGPSHDND